MPQPAERDVEKTCSDFTRWLATRVPEATDIELVSLGGPELTGFSSDTLMFDLAWTADGRRHEEPVVVRLKPTGGCQIFPEYDLTIQYRCMDVLRAVGVPAPRMLWLEEDPGPLGVPFYVMERLEGEIPPDRPPYHMEGWMLDASPETRASVWWSGLEAMARVHTCDWESLGFRFLDDPRYGKVGIDQWLGYYRQYLHWSLDGEPYPLCTRALDWLEANKPVDEPLRLCWGDSRIGNQIFDDGKCVAVLDWEMATLGNPVRDLAWYMYLDRHHSDGIGVERLAGLPSRDETIARWEELTGLEAGSTAKYYEVFGAMAFTVIMVRVARQMIYYEFLEADSDYPVNNTASALLEKVLDEARSGA